MAQETLEKEQLKPHGKSKNCIPQSTMFGKEAFPIAHLAKECISGDDLPPLGSRSFWNLLPNWMAFCVTCHAMACH